MSSLYAQYIKERTGKQVLETDTSFVVYHYTWDDAALFIDELYVAYEARRKRIGWDLADTLVATAKKRGVKYLVGTVDPLALNSADSIKALLAYGMVPNGVDGHLYVFIKTL